LTAQGAQQYPTFRQKRDLNILCVGRSPTSPAARCGGQEPDESSTYDRDGKSLADLGNSFEGIRNMSLVPFTRTTVLQLAVITLLPVAPLLLTMVSLEELVKRLF
jgi:hypothetical protein